MIPVWPRGAAILLAAMAAAAVAAAQDPAPAPPVGDEDAGRDVFAAECRICHAGAIAPLLRGAYGRAIAADPDYPAYSLALKAHAAETWTPAALDTFLKAPDAFAPGTRMTKALPDDQQRADVIAYLKAIAAPAT